MSFISLVDYKVRNFRTESDIEVDPYVMAQMMIKGKWLVYKLYL